MTNVSRRLLTIGTAVAIVIPGSMVAAVPPQGKSLSKNPKDLPAAVRQAIQDNRPGAEIDKLDVSREHGISFYDIEFKADQGEMDVTEDGTVLDVATVIGIKDVPDAAATAIRNAAKGRPIKRIEKSEVRAEIVEEGGKGRISKLSTPKYVYEAELASGEIEVTAEGKVIKVGK